MTFDYAGIRSLVAELLPEFGQSITLEYKTGGSIIPHTGQTVSAPTTSTITAYGVLLNFKKGEINGQSILATDKRVILEHVSSEPKTDWYCTVGGVKYNIVSVSPLNPGGTNLMYSLQLRL